jgi:hypothetical protein
MVHLTSVPPAAAPGIVACDDPKSTPATTRRRRWQRSVADSDRGGAMETTHGAAPLERRDLRPALLTAAAGLVIGQLAWIDATFIPMVLLGPLVTGFAAGRAGARRRWIVATWVLAGLVMLVSDWIVNDEDQLFHLIVSVVTGGLAAGAWSLGRRSRRGR